MPVATDPVPPQIARACRAVRPGGQADEVGGARPALVATPASTQEASALLRAAAELGLAVVPRGTGTKLGWGNLPRRCDLVVDMTGMNRVVEHAAGDLVATVQAGIGLDKLAVVLGAAGQRLALDPPALPPAPSAAATGPARGTAGGVLAAGAAGPLRLRYGTGRDLLIGITIVRQDGTVARSGGKVVKNVAGYDIGKLFAGSLGTLGLITEATFRLHPVPAAASYVTIACPAAADACHLVAAALASPVAPAAVEIDWPRAAAPAEVGILLEGDPAGVAERSRILADLLSTRAGGAVGGHAGVTVSKDPPEWWGRWCGHAPGGTLAQVAFWPGDLGLVLAEVRAAAQQAGVDPAIGGAAGAGVLHLAIPASVPAADVAAFVTVLRGAIGHGQPVEPGHRLTDVPSLTGPAADSAAPPQPAEPAEPAGQPGRATRAEAEAARAGAQAARARAEAARARADAARARAEAARAQVTGAMTARPGTAGDEHRPAGPGQRRSANGPPARASLVVLDAPVAVRELVDLFGPVPSVALMRAVKRQFDPVGMMAPGRFAEGI